MQRMVSLCSKKLPDVDVMLTLTLFVVQLDGTWLERAKISQAVLLCVCRQVG